MLWRLLTITLIKTKLLASTAIEAKLTSRAIQFAIILLFTIKRKLRIAITSPFVVTIIFKNLASTIQTTTTTASTGIKQQATIATKTISNNILQPLLELLQLQLILKLQLQLQKLKLTLKLIKQLIITPP